MICYRIGKDGHGSMNVEPTLTNFYSLIGTDCIDIVVRRIEGRQYNIVLDDEGILKGSPITATNGWGEALCGTLLVFDIGSDGDLAALDGIGTNRIRSKMAMVPFKDGTVRDLLLYDEN